MYDWCHSGLEAYCKSAATLMPDSVDGKEGADEGGKAARRRTQSDVQLQLCRDLLPDRTDETLTRAWTLSNVRKGRDCRMSLFEKCWLGDELRQTYFDEARLFAKKVVPEGGYATIPTGSDYEKTLAACTNDAGRKCVVTSRIEAEAIEACVDRVFKLLLDDDADEASSVVSLVMGDDFPVEFFNTVIPAIERGLLSERCRSSDIRQFVLTLNGAIYRAHRDLVSYLNGDDRVSLDTFRRFISALFAGLIYGPDHPLAISRQWDTTLSYEPSIDEDMERRDGTTIRVTQIFDDVGSQTGYSELYRPMQVVFFGRSPDVGEYLERCEQVFPQGSEVLDAVSTREKVIYPIAYHAAVSNKHAMLLCQGDTWWLYDLASTNGTSIATDDGLIDVQELSKVVPGDRLRMGVPAEARGANVYYDAATLHVTLNVDLAEDYV